MTSGYFDKEWVVSQCSFQLEVLNRKLKDVKEIYGRPYYYKEWSWFKFRFVEVKCNPCLWCETMEFDDSISRIKQIKEMAIKAYEVNLTPEDYLLITKKMPVIGERKLYDGCYYKDEDL